MTSDGAFSPLSDLRARIVGALASENSPASLEAVAKYVSNAERVADILRQILSSQSVLARRVAARSYTHPLGFDKFVLLSEMPSFQARLHVWWGQGQNVKEHVHNHRFDFASAVVSGRLEFEIFQPSSDGTPMTLLAESLHQGTGTLDWQFRNVGKLAIERILTASLCSGSSYFLNAETLHRVTVPVGKTTLTFFIETKSYKSSTAVLVEQEKSAPRHLDRPSMTLPECSKRLTQALAILDS